MPLEATAVDGLKKFLNDSIGFSMPSRWFLDSGNLALNYVMSGRLDGGYISGSTCEFFGDPATGKTLLLMKAAAAAQKRDIVVCIADAENRWYDDFAAVQGVDPDGVALYYPETVEEFAVKGYEIITEVVKDKSMLLILDSMAILSTLKEMEDIKDGDIKADQGRKAQKIHAAMRTLRTELRRTNSILLVSNHVIANPGSYVQSSSAPGGKAVPFQSNIRLELTKPTTINLPDKNIPIGVTIHVYVAKNSVFVPFGQCDMNLYWNTGVDRNSGLLDLMVDLEIIQRTGAWYYYREEAFQSTKFGAFLETHPEMLADVKWERPYFLGGIKSESTTTKETT